VSYPGVNGLNQCPSNCSLLYWFNPSNFKRAFLALFFLTAALFCLYRQIIEFKDFEELFRLISQSSVLQTRQHGRWVEAGYSNPFTVKPATRMDGWMLDMAILLHKSDTLFPGLFLPITGLYWISQLI